MAKTPGLKFFPESEHCPGFWKINAISGCPYSCATCYLDASSGRFNGGKKINSVAGVNATVKVVTNWLYEMGNKPAVLNTGETGDSWAFSEALPLNLAMADVFKERKQQLLFLTRSSTSYMGWTPEKVNCIFSFSVNPSPVCAVFNSPEINPFILQRLGLFQNRRIRLRLDPIIGIYGWASEYAIYISRIKAFLPLVEMFTLGSLRLTDANYRLRKVQGVELLKYIVREPDGGNHPWRVPYEDRETMYTYIIKQIRKHFPSARIGLCKEPQRMRDALGIRREDCNCQV